MEDFCVLLVFGIFCNLPDIPRVSQHNLIECLAVIRGNCQIIRGLANINQVVDTCCGSAEIFARSALTGKFVLGVAMLRSSVAEPVDFFDSGSEEQTNFGSGSNNTQKTVPAPIK